MTTFDRKTVQCAICGKSNEITFLTSTNEYEPRDLDFRPGRMKRSTMSTWVECCQSCGYASYDISVKLPDTSDILKSAEYQRIFKDQSLSSIAKAFLCNSLLLEKTNQTEDAMYNVLYAAWDCDDNENVEKAQECRNMALSLINRVLLLSTEIIRLYVIKLDLLRRTGNFTDAIEIAKEFIFDRGLLAVAKLQTRLCQEKDTKAHTFDEIE
jgi:hypothetical protein